MVDLRMSLDCQAVEELLPWYPGGLSAEEAAEVVWHLHLCSACQEEYAWLQALRAKVRNGLEAWPEPASQLWQTVLLRTQGVTLSQLRLGPEFLGLSLGLALRETSLPIWVELLLFGRKVPVFQYAGGVR